MKQETRKKKQFERAIRVLVECPKCGGHLKRFNRKNYPFGKKSKPRRIKGRQCTKCDYIEYDR